MSKPLVSFIITYHNEPVEYIVECLDSIFSLSLSDKEREIILVDDGSDNDALSILHPYVDKLFYIRQPNKGLSEARNLGLTIASAEYIQFIDADDFLIRAPYEHCLDLVRYHNPDIVMFRTTQHVDTEAPFILPEVVTGTEYLRHNNLRAAACGYIFRRTKLGTLRFTPNLLHEDEEFTPQLLLRCDRVFDTNDNSYFYRKREGSITQKKDKRWYLRRLNDKEYIICHLSEKKFLLAPDEQLALQRRIDQMSMDYLFDTIELTHSLHELESRIERLTQKGLYPLPEKNYTKKYATFRKLISSKTGRRILLGYCVLKSKMA